MLGTRSGFLGWGRRHRSWRRACTCGCCECLRRRPPLASARLLNLLPQPCPALQRRGLKRVVISKCPNVTLESLCMGGMEPQLRVSQAAADGCLVHESAFASAVMPAQAAYGPSASLSESSIPRPSTTAGNHRSRPCTARRGRGAGGGGPAGGGHRSSRRRSCRRSCCRCRRSCAPGNADACGRRVAAQLSSVLCQHAIDTRFAGPVPTLPCPPPRVAV